jgi:hypothetical protein
VGALLSLGRFSYANLLLVFTKLHIRLTHSLRHVCRRLRLSHRFGSISSSPEVHSQVPVPRFFGTGTSGR